MASDSKVIFSTELDSSGINRGLNKLQSSVTGMASGLGAALGTAGVAIFSGIIAGASELVTKSIAVASSLQEVQNVVDTTFEDGADSVNKFAVAAKEAYGMSELKAKQFTSTMGAMLKSMGMAADETLDMSTAMTGLAGDMASFYNLDYDTAFEKLRSGISGETEPLKQLGINMSVANLSAYALSKGITKSYDSMTQAEQTTLRYNYLMQVTADAQGDFARTSDGYANQQRILATTQEELSATIGEVLLPMAVEGTKILNTLVGELGEAAKGLDAFFNPPKSKLDTQIADAKKAIEDFNGAISLAGANLDTSLATAKATQATAMSLLGNYEKISSKNVLTEQDTAQLQTIARQIVALYPDMGLAIDSATGLFNTNTGAVKDNITALADQQTAMAYYAATQEYQAALLKATVVQQQAFSAYDASYQDWIAKDTAARAATGLRDAIASNWNALGDFAGALISIDPSLASFFKITKDGKYVLTELAKSMDYQREIIDKLDTGIGVLASTADEASASTTKLEDSWNGTKDATKTATDEMTLATESLTELGDAFEIPTQGADDLTAATGSLAGGLTSVVNGTRAETAEMEKLRSTLKTLSEDTLKQIDSQVEGFEKINKVRPKSAKKTTANVNSETKYLDDYAANFKKAQESGVTPEALASLATVNEENAAILAGLASANDKQVTSFNTAYAERVQAATDLASTLAGFQTELEAANTSATATLDAATAATAEVATQAATTTDAAATVGAAAAAEVTQAATDVGTSVTSIIASRKTAKAAAEGIVTDVTGVIDTANPDVELLGASIIDSVATGIADNTALADELETNASDAIDDTETNTETAAKGLGKAIVTSAGEGARNATGLRTGLISAVTAATSAAKTSATLQSYSIGNAMITSMVQSLEDNKSALERKLKSVIKEAVRKAIEALLGAGTGDNTDNSIGDAAANGLTALNNTLLGRVQNSLAANTPQYPTASGVSASMLRGAALSGYSSNNSTVNNSPTTVDARQTIVFETPMQAPDEIARAIRKQRTYGLAGGVRA